MPLKKTATVRAKPKKSWAQSRAWNKLLRQHVLRLRPGAQTEDQAGSLRLACMGSGTGSAAWALRDLLGGGRFRHVMAVENMKDRRQFILENHPDLELLITDLNSKEFESESVDSDIAVAGIYGCKRVRLGCKWNSRVKTAAGFRFGTGSRLA